MKQEDNDVKQSIIYEFNCYQSRVNDMKRERDEIEKRLQSSNLVLAILLGISVSFFIYILTLNLSTLLYFALCLNIISFIILFFTLVKTYEKLRILSNIFYYCDYYANSFRLNDNYGFYFEHDNPKGMEEEMANYKHEIHECYPRLTSVGYFEKFIFWGLKGGIFSLIGCLVVFCFWKSYLIGLFIVFMILIVYLLFYLSQRFLEKNFGKDFI